MSTQNHEKLTYPCPKNVSTGSIPPPPLPSVHVRCEHTINFEKFDVGFCNKKCGRPHLNNHCPKNNWHWATPLTCWLRTYFYGQPLTLTSYQLILNLKVLTQHCSSLVVHIFEISIIFEIEMFEILFSVG